MPRQHPPTWHNEAAKPRCGCSTLPSGEAAKAVCQAPDIIRASKRSVDDISRGLAGPLRGPVCGSLGEHTAIAPCGRSAMCYNRTAPSALRPRIPQRLPLLSSSCRASGAPPRILCKGQFKMEPIQMRAGQSRIALETMPVPSAGMTGVFDPVGQGTRYRLLMRGTAGRRGR